MRNTLRHNDIDEVIGSPPAWLTRWGITIITSIILILFIGAYFFKYPEIISGPVIITSENLPVWVDAPSNGEVDSIYVSDKEEITKDQIVCVIKNAASTKDVYSLKEDIGAFLDTYKITKSDSIFIPSKRLRVGELNDYYIQLLKLIDSYVSFSDEMIKTAENQKAKKELQVQYENLIISYNSLYNKILEWEKRNVLKSPINGKITFPIDWNKKQLIYGNKIFKITPDNYGAIWGKCYVRTEGLIKIKEGQRVVIKINEYPYLEYGLLTGYVGSISSLNMSEYGFDPQNRHALIEVSFCDKVLYTSYNKQIYFNGELTGTAEIVTKEMSLLKHLINPMKYLWNNMSN